MNNVTHLQGIGKVKAKQVKDFAIGEKIMWNYGGVSEILEVVKETKSFITFKMLSTPLRRNDEPFTHERRMGKNRLAAIAS